jgi:uncharacterized YccA/Bax inhibitor family protein
VRTSSNPAFRNLPQGQGNGGYATFDRQGGGAMSGASAYADSRASQVEHGRAGSGERPITIDDVVMKTGLSAGTALVLGTLTAVSGLYALALPAFIVGFVVSLVPHLQAAVVGRAPGAPVLRGHGCGPGRHHRRLRPDLPRHRPAGHRRHRGRVPRMLVVYKTGAVRVTPRFTKWLMGALIGVVVLMLFNLVMSLFGVNTGLRDGGPLAIGFSLLVIGVAAFSLLLDFDQADQAIRGGAPAKFAWYIAFGLMTTLVWLYIEILRLLSYLRQD